MCIMGIDMVITDGGLRERWPGPFGPLLDHGGGWRPCKTALNPFPFVGGSYPASSWQ